jgi:integral membrane protein
MEKALARFKFIAYLAGVILILFTIEIIIKYTLGPEIPWFAQLHGIVYMIYVVIAFDISRRAKLSLSQTLLVLLAGTVPIMSFIAEKKIRRRITNSLKLIFKN